MNSASSNSRFCDFKSEDAASQMGAGARVATERQYKQPAPAQPSPKSATARHQRSGRARGRNTCSTKMSHRDPPWFQEEDDIDDDEWFYKSIKRYAHLCMYSLSCRVDSIDVAKTHPDLVCVGGRLESDDLNEVLLLHLPPKLLASCPVEEGLQSRRDFGFVAGARETNPHKIQQVMLLPSGKEVASITQHVLTLWRRKETTDLLVKSKSLKFDPSLLGFRFLGDDFLVFSSDRLLLVDGEKFHVIAEFPSSEIQDVATISSAGKLEAAIVTHPCGRITRMQMNKPNVEEEIAPILLNRNTTNGLSSVVCEVNPDLVALLDESILAVAADGGQRRVAEVPHGLNTQYFTKMYWKKSEEILVCSDNLVWLFSFDLNSARIVPQFCHDGHTSRITDLAVHPTVSGLVISADERKRLHAWICCPDD